MGSLQLGHILRNPVFPSPTYTVPVQNKTLCSFIPQHHQGRPSLWFTPRIFNTPPHWDGECTEERRNICREPLSHQGKWNGLGSHNNIKFIIIRNAPGHGSRVSWQYYVIDPLECFNGYLCKRMISHVGWVLSRLVPASYSLGHAMGLRLQQWWGHMALKTLLVFYTHSTIVYVA